jgi:hypothetical protein
MKRQRCQQVRPWVEELEARVNLSPVPLFDAVSSTNWSGYAAESSFSSPQSNYFTSVSGSWVVPAVKAPPTAAYSSFWVGLDGYSSSSVEQIGTDSDVDSHGVAHYYAWYEMYPNPSFQITSITVSPGDTVSASVTYGSYANNNNFQLQITDTPVGGTAQTATILQKSTSAKLSSAEWIAEAPSASFFRILPLADFGTVNFSQGAATSTSNSTPAPIGTGPWANTAINMTTRTGVLKATTSSLDTTTASNFSVTWKSSGASTGGHSSHGVAHANAEMLQDAEAGARSGPQPGQVFNLGASNAIPLNNVVVRPSAVPLPSSHPAWMTAGSMDREMPTEDDEASEIALPIGSAVNTQAGDKSISILTPPQGVTQQDAAVRATVVLPPALESGSETSVPVVSESRTADAVAVPARPFAKILGLAGMALFFAHGALFGKPRARHEEESDREPVANK